MPDIKKNKFLMGGYSYAPPLAGTHHCKKTFGCVCVCVCVCVCICVHMSVSTSIGIHDPEKPCVCVCIGVFYVCT